MINTKSECYFHENILEIHAIEPFVCNKVSVIVEVLIQRKKENKPTK